MSCMTITKQNGYPFKNKKEIREYIKTGNRPLLQDPSLFSPVLCGYFFDLTKDFQSSEFPLRFSFVVPSQYDRRYYGTISLSVPDGKIKVE